MDCACDGEMTVFIHPKSIVYNSKNVHIRYILHTFETILGMFLL